MQALTKTGLVDVETLEGTSKAMPDKEVLDDEEMVRMRLLAGARHLPRRRSCKNTIGMRGTHETD